MLFCAVLVDALHTAFKDREVAFQRVHMDRAANVFASAMLNREMVLELLVNLGVQRGLVGH